jgi:serine/threonine protein kinase
MIDSVQSTSEAKKRIKVEMSPSIVKNLGSGSNGSVFLMQENGEHFVRKMFLKEVSLVNEISIYEKLKNINGVLQMKRFSYEVDARYYGYIDFEYFEDARSVDEYYSYLSEEEIIDISIQVSRTLNEIHELNIVHRDIKTENILYDRTNKKAFVIDWDCSVSSEDVIEPTEYFGTLYVNPVEFFTTKRYNDSKKIDVWQFGAFLFDILKDSGNGVLFDCDEDIHPCQDQEFLDNIRSFNWNADAIDENTKILYLLEKIFKPEHLRISMYEVNEFLEDMGKQVNARKSY